MAFGLEGTEFGMEDEDEIRRRLLEQQMSSPTANLTGSGLGEQAITAEEGEDPMGPTPEVPFRYTQQELNPRGAAATGMEIRTPRARSVFGGVQGRGGVDPGFEYLGLSPQDIFLAQTLGLSAKDTFSAMGTKGLKSFKDVTGELDQFGGGGRLLGLSEANKMFDKSLSKMAVSDHQLASKAEFLSTAFDKDKYGMDRGQVNEAGPAGHLFRLGRAMGAENFFKLMQDPEFSDPRVQAGLIQMGKNMGGGGRGRTTGTSTAISDDRAAVGERTPSFQSAGGGGGPRSPLYSIGKYKDPETGEFDISRLKQTAKDLGREPDLFGSPGLATAAKTVVKAAPVMLASFVNPVAGALMSTMMTGAEHGFRGGQSMYQQMGIGIGANLLGGLVPGGGGFGRLGTTSIDAVNAAGAAGMGSAHGMSASTINQLAAAPTWTAGTQVGGVASQQLGKAAGTGFIQNAQTGATELIGGGSRIMVPGSTFGSMAAQGQFSPAMIQGFTGAGSTSLSSLYGKAKDFVQSPIGKAGKQAVSTGMDARGAAMGQREAMGEAIQQGREQSSVFAQGGRGAQSQMLGLGKRGSIFDTPRPDNPFYDPIEDVLSAQEGAI